ncbi:MAG TPA: PQQ-binding-like beta-propeller repeat protein [Pirellulales bacterium]|jgi:outer membrane protein assembly factor BamB|nr:PQQ-binding-like beta-propeller repeat protein [Pirellulales bacterium]
MKPRLATIIGLLSIAQIAVAADWPQFRGPNRDDVSRETGLLKSWPSEGPSLVWEAKGLGHGYSSVSVAGNHIYTLGNADNVSKMFALARDGGKILWSAEVGASGGNLGCTPTVDHDRVYALGQKGDLVCLRTSDGSRIWHRDLIKDLGGVKGVWDYCESPLVDGNHLVVTPGGKEATMAALDKLTGETVWKCAVPLKSPEAGYSSIVVAEVGGIKQYVQLLNGGVAGVSTDGKPLWQYEKLGPNTANIPTPIVLNDEILAVAGYGKGGALLKLTASGNQMKVEQVYFKRELTNKHGGVLVVDGFAYGDTDDSGHPFCAEVSTGKIFWKRAREGDGRGSASVTYADGRLYVQYDNGVIALVEASPDGYKETGSFHVKTDGQAWAHPVVVGGRLYLREGNSLYCYDVRKKD